MGLLRAHRAAVAIVAAAVLATTGVFVFARPQPHPHQTPPPPGDGLPYTDPVYTRADAVRAFAAHGIHLVRGAHSPGIAGMHTADAKILVDVFGDKQVVDAQGFSDYYTLTDGKWTLAPKNCVPGARSAERWRGNVRLIVYCDAPADLPLAARALASIR